MRYKTLTIIPAAGKGSRVNLKIPKILIKIGKEKIIDLLIKKVKDVSDEIIFVASPKHQIQIKDYLDKKYKNKIKYRIILQKNALGMGDAVFKASKLIKSYNKILLIWGDHIGISKSSIDKIMKIKFQSNTCVLPLIKVKNPYVEYVFKNKKLESIQESREGDKCKDVGFSDMGTFLFFSNKLDKYIKKFNKKKIIGKITKEKNFLPFIFFLSVNKWNIKKVIFKNKIQTQGVNTRSDIQLFNKKYKYKN